MARQLSVWPFAARTQRLYLLVDPSLPDDDLRAGLLKAMQQAYFRSDTCSQTRAVREAASAAHYVLQHRNRDVLPQDQVSAATAVAAVRGDQAYIALAGDATVFAWRSGELTGQRGFSRLPRPLGLEQDPRITLWSTPLARGDRLVLACGAAWGPASAQAMAEVLGGGLAGEAADERLANALGGSRPAGVLIADPARATRPDRHLVLVSSVERGRDYSATEARATSAARKSQPSTPVPRSRWLSSLLALALLGAATVAALNPTAEPPRRSLAHQAQALLAQADETVDPYEAHALAARALELAQSASSQAPDALADLGMQATTRLNQIDRVIPVSPGMAVRLGPSGGNVVDLVIADDALYTLDAVEGSVRAFNLDGRDQAPTPDTLLARAGSPIAGTSRRLSVPVAMQYVGGALTIVDQARNLVQLGRDRSISPRPFTSSGSWLELGALGVDTASHLFVLDSGAQRLLEYPLQNERLVDSPRVIVDPTVAPQLAFHRVAEIAGVADQVFLRMDDGTLHRFDKASQQQDESLVSVRPPDGRLPVVAGLTPDRAGGLYLADPLHARIVHASVDGSFIRQLRDPALAGVREIQSSLDGRRIYGLVASGVLLFDVPELGTPA